MASRWSGAGLLTFEWVLVAITFFVVAIRLYVSLKGIRRLPYYRDILVVSAWIFYTVVVALDCPVNDMDGYNHDVDPAAAPEDQQVLMLKLSMAQSGFYALPVYICQADLLFLFANLIAPRANHPMLFRLILFTWFIVIVGFLVQLFVYFLSCLPFNINWDPNSGCEFSYAGCIASCIILAITDVILYSIPTAIIFNMQKMTMQEKLSAGAMFLLGFFNIFCGLFGAILNIISDKASWEVWGASLFLISLQQATAIVIVCMPQVRLMYRLVVKDIIKKNKGSGAEEGDSNTFALSDTATGGRKWDESKNISVVATEHDDDVNFFRVTA